ncbi:MAG: type II secretion system protein N, partial [Pseudomonadota bacterium]
MLSLRRLIVAGLVTFLAGLIILFPARVAVNLVEVPGVALAGIEGSVWRGYARDVSIGDVYVSDLSWKISPLRLLTGALKLDVEASPPDGYVEANVALKASGRVEVRDLRFAIPLPMIAAIAQVPGLNGRANGSFEQIVIDEGLPVAAD